MIAVFIKELRENAKWALLILGAFLVFVLLEMSKGNPFILNQLAQQRTVLLAPLAGLLMGVAQSFFGTRPDNWAFLVHRPVSRWSVFAVTCATGVALLYMSLTLPCLIVAFWAERPGNVATPFHFRALLPMLADVFNASCFYFVGIVLTLRKARWFGSRLLPLGLAIVSSIGVLTAQEFWQAIVISGLCTLLSAWAAWGVFSTSGVADCGLLPRVSLSVMIFAGALGIGVFVESFVGVFNTAAAWKGLRLDPGGNVLRVYWTLVGTERTCIITDANGQPVEEYRGLDVDDPANAGRFVQFTNVLFDDRSVPWPYSMLTCGYRSVVSEVVRLRAVTKPNVPADVNIASRGGRDLALPVAAGAARVPYICVLDAIDQIIKLYDPITHALLGTIGPQGFEPAATEPRERFPSTPLNLFIQPNSHTLTFPSVVYWMELDYQRVRPLFTARTDDPVVAACELPPQTDPRVVVLTQSKLRIMKPSGEVILAVPFDLDRSSYFLQFAILPSNSHVAVLAEPLPDAEGSASRQVFEYSLEGKLVRQTTLADLEHDVPARMWQRTATMGAVWPPALVWLYAACDLDVVFETNYRLCWSSFVRSMLFSSILCGILAFLICRRLGFGIAVTMAWSAMSLLLGFAGVVVMLSMYEWPAREICASCGRMRLIGRRECIHCGVPLAPPALDGREIFEPLNSF